MTLAPLVTRRHYGPLTADLDAMSRDDRRAEVDRAKSAIDAAYWTFTRCARGYPPPEHLYARHRWATEALYRCASLRAAEKLEAP